MKTVVAWRKSRYIIPCIIASLLTGLVAATIVGFFYERARNDGQIMLQELDLVHSRLMQIHETCRILSFDSQKNPVNFLNIKTFAGSEVGSMNLAYPGKWEGPYLPDNPTMHAREYLVVRTRKGHFITPGVGVGLPNGKIIGQDILLDEDADIADLASDPDGLMYGDKALAIELKI